MKLSIKNNILIALAFLLPASFSLTAQGAENDCTRYDERLDELKLFMRQNPSEDQKFYFQTRYQELMGGKLFCEQGSSFEVPEIEASPVATQSKPKVKRAQGNNQKNAGNQQAASKSKAVDNSFDENVTPIFPAKQEQPQQVVKLSPAEPIQAAAEKQSQQLVIVEPDPQPQKDTPRLPPGLTKQQYHQSLCKLARDTYADEPTERNRKKVAKFCE